MLRTVGVAVVQLLLISVTDAFGFRGGLCLGVARRRKQPERSRSSAHIAQVKFFIGREDDTGTSSDRLISIVCVMTVGSSL